MTEYKYSNLFVLCHQTSIFAYKKILKDGELRSSAYQSTDKITEGVNMGGAPNKIYLTLMKIDDLKKFEKSPSRDYDVLFYLHPSILLNFIGTDSIKFSPNWNYGKDGISYHSFEALKKPIKGFEDLWPENKEEELALNLNYFYSIFKEDIVGQKSFQNEIMIETETLPINEYLLDIKLPHKFLLRRIGMKKELIDSLYQIPEIQR